MERRAAVEYLLKIAENTMNSGNPKLSSIVSDLARRVALSLESEKVNLHNYCSKMAAELLFRDDYVNANKLIKIADLATMPSDEILPIDEQEQDQEEQILPEQKPVGNETFIKENLPSPAPSMPQLDSNKLQEFIDRLNSAGVEITTQSQEQSKDQDDSGKNPSQMEENQNSLPENQI